MFTLNLYNGKTWRQNVQRGNNAKNSLRSGVCRWSVCMGRLRMSRTGFDAPYMRRGFHYSLVLM
jgi:hypothetical protein